MAEGPCRSLPLVVRPTEGLGPAPRIGSSDACRVQSSPLPSPGAVTPVRQETPPRHRHRHRPSRRIRRPVRRRRSVTDPIGAIARTGRVWRGASGTAATRHSRPRGAGWRGEDAFLLSATAAATSPSRCIGGRGQASLRDCLRPPREPSVSPCQLLPGAVAPRLRHREDVALDVSLQLLGRGEVAVPGLVDRGHRLGGLVDQERDGL